MEIITWVIDGALEHRDSMGNGSVIRPGDLQRMSAGTGVTHSEYNQSQSDLVHLLQIWILPEREGLTPSYEQKHFDAESRRGALCALASPDGRDGSVRVHQDATLYATLLGAGEWVRHELAPGRRAWVQGVRGTLALGDVQLAAGDGAAISGESSIELRAEVEAEALVFDLA